MTDDRYYIQKLDRAWAILDSRGRGPSLGVPAMRPCAARAPWLFDARSCAELVCAERNHESLLEDVAA